MMPAAEPTNEIQLGPQGRVVIPARLRKVLQLKPGDRLVVRLDGDSIIIERRETVVRRLQARFSHVPRDESLANELIEERRLEALRDAEP